MDQFSRLSLLIEELDQNNQVLIIIDFKENVINMHGAIEKNSNKLMYLDYNSMFRSLIFKKWYRGNVNENKNIEKKS